MGDATPMLRTLSNRDISIVEGVVLYSQSMPSDRPLASSNEETKARFYDRTGLTRKPTVSI